MIIIIYSPNRFPFSNSLVARQLGRHTSEIFDGRKLFVCVRYPNIVIFLSETDVRDEINYAVARTISGRHIVPPTSLGGCNQFMRRTINRQNRQKRKRRDAVDVILCGRGWAARRRGWPAR